MTGGASGRATAERLTADGAQVLLLDLPSSGGDEVAQAIGHGTRFVAADVTAEESVGAAIDLARELGDLRVCVSCAGIGPAQRTLGRNSA